MEKERGGTQTEGVKGTEKERRDQKERREGVAVEGEREGGGRKEREGGRERAKASVILKRLCCDSCDYLKIIAVCWPSASTPSV